MIFHNKTYWLLIIFIIVYFGCSRKNGSDTNNTDSIVLNESVAAEASVVVKDFISKYKNSFNIKNSNEIINLYVSNPSKSLESAEALTELFVSSDTASIFFSNIKINFFDIKRSEFEALVETNISLGGKKIIEKKIVSFVLLAEKNAYLLADKKTQKIL